MSDTAFIVAYAGIEDANGPYTPTGKVRYGAPIYENDRKCILSREPHTNSATRQTSHGWIIGQGGKPLYGVQTETLSPPSSGWMKFGGAFPLPRLETVTVADAALVAAEQLKEQGKVFFAEKRYDLAESKWSRALALADLPDKDLVLALYANRAEAKLRQYKWAGALADANEALKRNPIHDKALLRAAVASREMKEYPQAMDFVQQCLDAHPTHADAKHLYKEVERLLEAENEVMATNTLKNAKVQEEWLNTQGVPEGEQGILPKAFAAKDTTSKKGFGAFAGYGKDRTGDAEEAAPVDSLPYHGAGLPDDKVDAMDKALQAHREKQEAKRQKAKEEQEIYPRIKQDYKERAAENLKMSKAEPIERIMPVSKQVPQAVDDVSEVEAKIMAQALKGSGEGAPLSQVDTDAIDAMFAGFQTAPAIEVAKAPAGGRKAKLKQAKALVSSAGGLSGLSTVEMFARLEKMVTGKDGKLLKKDVLDKESKDLVDLIAKYQKAKSGGQSLAPLEKELGRFKGMIMR